MQTRVLVIAGTFAPRGSQLYYQALLNVVQNIYGVSAVEFETIPKLGLGDTQAAATHISQKHLESSGDNWVLIGHSQGGIIASLIAIEHQSKVSAVVAIASPLAGTVWTDPINMPVRIAVEAVSRLSKGRILLRPKLRRLIAPIPVVRNLAAHSDVSEQILEYLCMQQSGFSTYCIVGLADLLVFPHRSAHPEGQLVQNYLIAPESVYSNIKDRLPGNITHICATAGHMSIIHNPLVHELLQKIVSNHTITTQAV